MSTRDLERTIGLLCFVYAVGGLGFSIGCIYVGGRDYFDTWPGAAVLLMAGTIAIAMSFAMFGVPGLEAKS
jgi:hypothetical protein